jgi:hypothetical protein
MITIQQMITKTTSFFKPAGKKGGRIVYHTLFKKENTIFQLANNEGYDQRSKTSLYRLCNFEDNGPKMSFY